MNQINKKMLGKKKMGEKRMGEKKRARGFGSSLLLALAVILVVASCSSTHSIPMRGQSTGKTIKSATPPPDESDAVIFSAISAGDPGVTDIEIYEGTGEFIDKEAARRRPDIVSEDGGAALAWAQESGEDFDRGGFSRAVWAEESEDFPRSDFDR